MRRFVGGGSLVLTAVGMLSCARPAATEPTQDPSGKASVETWPAPVASSGAVRASGPSQTAPGDGDAGDRSTVSSRLLFRTDHVARAEGCEAGGTLVFVGLDTNGDKRLDQREQQPQPMVFCSADDVEGTIADVPPNQYCSRPGAVVTLRHAKTIPGTHAEIIVCFDPSRTAVESTYSVYDAR